MFWACIYVTAFNGNRQFLAYAKLFLQIKIFNEVQLDCQYGMVRIVLQNHLLILNYVLKMCRDFILFFKKLYIVYKCDILWK